MSSARRWLVPVLATAVAIAGARAQTSSGAKGPTVRDLPSGIGKLPTTKDRKVLGLEGTPLEKKKSEAPEKKAKGQTEISAQRSTFDQKTRQAVFIGTVVVKDPEFNVKCDRLIADLKKAPIAGGDAPIDAGSGLEVPGKKAGKGGGLEKATAEANPGGIVVITQEKKETDGSISLNIGKAKKAVYDSETGNIVLTGMPTVQQGINVCAATEEGTVMILNRDGKMDVQGDAKTTINDTEKVEGLR